MQLNVFEVLSERNRDAWVVHVLACQTQFGTTLAGLTRIRSEGEAQFVSVLPPFSTNPSPAWVGVYFNATTDAWTSTLPVDPQVDFHDLDLWYANEPSSVGAVPELCVQQGITNKNPQPNLRYLFNNALCSRIRRSICQLCPERPSPGAPATSTAPQTTVASATVPVFKQETGCCRATQGGSPTVIGLFRVDFTQECQDLCIANPFCTAFELHMTEAQCKLFDGNITGQTTNVACRCYTKCEASVAEPDSVVC